MINILLFANCTGYFINLEIHIYYSGMLRWAGALRHVHHFILYYIITILFKTHIMNNIIYTLHFVSNIRYVINLNIHIYYSGAPRRAGAPRRICHFIPYYIITILFKIHIMNLINNELQSISNIGYVINLNICIYYSGVLRRAGALRHVCHFGSFPIYAIQFLVSTYVDSFNKG